jgi:hypothetical protein
VKIEKTPEQLRLLHDPVLTRWVGYLFIGVGILTLAIAVLIAIPNLLSGLSNIDASFLLSGIVGAVLLVFLGNFIRESGGQKASFIFDRPSDTVTYTRSRGSRTLETVSHPLAEVEELEASQQRFSSKQSKGKGYNLILHLSGDRVQPFLVSYSLGKRESQKACRTLHEFLGISEIEAP